MADNQRKIRHDCVNSKCSKCDQKYNPHKGTHDCLMKSLKKKDNKWPEKNDIYAFSYDVETYWHNEQNNKKG